MARSAHRQLALALDPDSSQDAPPARRGRSHSHRPAVPAVAGARPRSSARLGLADARSRLALGAAGLAERLAGLLGEHVRLTLTDNTSTMVSFRRSRGHVAFRVHQMFVDAPGEVIRALADYAGRGRRSAGSVIDEYVRANEHRVKRVRAERQLRGLDPFGRVHDLQAIYDELNARFFGGAIEARIGWGREAPARRRRSIKMGTYFHDARVIKVHPALDREEVPAFFVRFVVFHEMLHQAVPPQLEGGRRISHSGEFRRREQAYPEYERALAWESAHLALLLGARPRRWRFDPDDPLA